MFYDVMVLFCGTMKNCLIIILIFLVACGNKPKKENPEKRDTTQYVVPVQGNDTSAPTEILETFVDSTNIGEKGECKVELIKHRVHDDVYVIVKFYTKNYLQKWWIQNTYLYVCNALENLDPQIIDFNNDGRNDMTFISADAARGANEVRRLFIYKDWGPGELISIVNSENYPNMQYNDELNCIDAFLVYGGSATVFLRIDGDSLKEFASVVSYENRTVYEIDKHGMKKQLSKDTLLPDDLYIRYKNYKPLKEYKLKEYK